jgi:hypothetical protein
VCRRFNSAPAHHRKRFAIKHLRLMFFPILPHNGECATGAQQDVTHLVLPYMQRLIPPARGSVRARHRP